MARFIAILLAAAIGTAATAQSRADLAAQNYLAIQNGSKRIGDLSPQEVADIRELDRRLAEQRKIVPRDCDRQAQAAKTDLDRAVLSLKCPPQPD